MFHLHALVFVALLSSSAASLQLPRPDLPHAQAGAASGAAPVLFHPGNRGSLGGRGIAADPAVVEARVRGFVLDPDHRPAEGALVVSDQGGMVQVQADGSFELVVPRARSDQSLRISAVGSGGALGQAIVPLDAAGANQSPVSMLLASGVSCSPEWLPTFGGGYDSPSDIVYALEVFDDGSGPALFVGGGFTSIGEEPIQVAARFDGAGWTQVGELDGWILDFEVYDNGSGPALYAAGSLSHGVIRWNGIQWISVGGAFTNTLYQCLEVFDDGLGRGPLLYAGGLEESKPWGYRAIAVRTDGTGLEDFGFNALWGPTLYERVYCMEVFDDGAGPALFMGGRFQLDTTVPAGNLVHLRGGTITGAEWASAAPFTGTSLVYDLHAWQTQGVDYLVVAGDLMNFPVDPEPAAVVFDGTGWSTLFSGTDIDAYRVFSHDAGDGEGDCLIVNGNFGSINGQIVNGIARLTLDGWESMGANDVFIVRDDAVFDAGDGGELFAAIYPNVPSVDGNSMLRWKPTVWSSFKSYGDAPNGAVYDLLVHDDGSGPALYAAGSFTAVGNVAANRVARFDGQSWSALGNGLVGTVHDLETFETTSGPRLLAAGSFLIPDGGSNLAAFDGTSWAPFGPNVPGAVYAMRAVDGAWIGGGGGPDRLYVTGSFVFAGSGGGGGSDVRNLTYLSDNNQWVRVGNGLNAPGRTLALMEEAGVVSLFVGGDFTQAGLLAANRVARLQLAASPGSPGQGGGNNLWSLVGTGTNGPVLSLAVFDDGTGEALYAGGQFSSASGAPAQNLARFANGAWVAPLGVSLPLVAGSRIERLHVHDDGRGAALYATGLFSFAGGVAARDIARFDGSNWSALDGGLAVAGLSVTGRALASFALSAGGPVDLFVGGSFNSQPDSGDQYMARWGCLPGPAFVSSPGCAGNPASLSTPCASFSVGQACALQLGSPEPQGVALLYLGILGIDGNGCGLFVPGIGELLLSISTPAFQLGLVPTVAGVSTFLLTVPNDSAFVGTEVSFQAAHIAAALPGPPIAMSNALTATIGL